VLVSCVYMHLLADDVEVLLLSITMGGREIQIVDGWEGQWKPLT